MSSIVLHSKFANHSPVIARRVSTLTAISSVKYPSQNLLQIKKPCTNPFLRKEISEELAIKSTVAVDGLLGLETEWVSREGTARRTTDDVLVEEIEFLMQRLESLVERFRVLEMEKLVAKTEGQISSDEKRMIEMMSREIVDRFLEKPIQYLRCKGGHLKCKSKDLKALVGMLEESCLSDEKPQCRRGSRR